MKLNMPKIQFKNGKEVEKLPPVKLHTQPKSPRLYQRVSDARDLYSVIKGHGERIAFSYFGEKRQVLDLSYGELAGRIEQISAGLTELGLVGKRIAIIGETSVEWIASYIAILATQSVVIPMDKELDIKEIEGFLAGVEADAIIYSPLFHGRFTEARKTHPSLTHYIPMKPTAEEAALPKTYPFSELVDKGDEALARGYVIPPITSRESLAELLFTSGTTGTSKSVMLSQRNIFSVVTAASATVDFHPDDTIVSVLPIHHTYELACVLAGLDYGMHICINDSLTHVLKNFQLFKPTGLVLVPLFVYTMYKKIWTEAKKSGRDKTLKVGIAASQTMMKMGIDKRESIFAEVRNSFGGRLKKIICGGAALNPKMIEFFENFGISIYEGFGITECAPLTCVTPYYARKYGSVGPAVPCCQVRIDGEVLNARGFVEGEIQVKGDNVMLGYYGNEEATNAAFTEDGWFRTGDMGYMDEDDYVFITGRLKTVIVLENGKNIFPEEIEEYLGNIDRIAECVVVGRASNEKVNLVAVVYPDFSKFPEGCEIQTIHDAIWAEIDAINKCLPTYKQIKQLEIRDVEFEKTTSRKIKRHKVK